MENKRKIPKFSYKKFKKKKPLKAYDFSQYYVLTQFK